MRTINEKQFEKDKKLEEDLLKIQPQMSLLRNVLGDFIFMDSPSNDYVCLKKRNKNSFFKTYQKNYDVLIATVKEINTILSPKVYSDKHLANNVFDIKLQPMDYFRLNIKVLIGTLERQTTQILKNRTIALYKKNELLIGQCLYFYEMIFDMSAFFDEMYSWKQVEYIEFDKQSGLDDNHKIFLKNNRQKAFMRKQFMALDILQASKMIVNRYFYRNDISVVPVAIFQLRQAIEIRILEVLGVYRIEKANGIPEKITANTFLEIKDLEVGIVFPIPKSAIEKIYTWTNLYIHQGIASSYWLLEFAQYYLTNFILMKPVVLKSYYEQLPQKISIRINCDANCIIRRNVNVELVDDANEFDKIKEFIKSKGYRKYEEEKDKQFINSCKINKA